MGTELETLLIERIEREGPMPFAAFMSQALYHPKLGYYSRGVPRTGWAGHFVTSPELDPIFGELWAAAFEQIWVACDRPDPFRVVEIGPGEGSFATAVLDSARGPFSEVLTYVLIERIPKLEERQRERLADRSSVEWAKAVDEIPPAPGVVFANEVLDNLPVHIVEAREERLFEVLVEVTRGKLVLTRRAPAGTELADFIARTGLDLRDGHMLEVAMAAESLVTRAASVVERGAVIFIDYGMDARGAAERPEGTLVCYSSTGTDTEPLERVGEKDITVHANWTVVGNALRSAGHKVVGPVMQRRILSSLGLSDRDDALRDEHQAALAAKQGAAALRALSRRQALGALSDPGGLGGLQVVAGLNDVAPPPFLQPQA